MGLVLFYHLTQSPLQATATNLLTRALQTGWRVMVRGTDVVRLKALDDQLWLGADDGFLPHGMEGGPQDADQPVLLGMGGAVNGARAVMLIDGADPLPEELLAMERVWVVFDGNDQAALQTARVQWKTLTGQGHKAQYWSEETGKWVMKAER